MAGHGYCLGIFQSLYKALVFCRGYCLFL